ncbi:MAG: DUF2066 domain-containing protein [Porticoccaceae bacterium]
MCFSLAASASQATDLYRVLVPVDDQTTESREIGIKIAFSEMLVKLSGNSQILQSPQLKPFLSDPKAYLDSVGFNQLSNTEADKNIATGLDVKFDRPSVDKLLKQAQLPIIPAIRPTFLVWLMVDDIVDGRRVLDESSAEKIGAEDHFFDLLEAFNDSMQTRAIPYFLPSYDLEDQLSLSAKDAWAMNIEALNNASKRYEADGWFALRIFKASDGQIRGAWAYQEAGNRQMDDFYGDSMVDLIGDSVDQVLDALLQTHTYIPQLETDKLLVQIDGVLSFKNYQAALARLEQLELVEALQLYSVSEGELVVAIEINAGVELFHSDLIRTGLVKPYLSSDNRSIGRLTYRWVGQ